MKTLIEAIADSIEKRLAAAGREKTDIEAMERVEHRGAGKIQSWRNTEPAGSRRFEQRKED